MSETETSEITRKFSLKVEETNSETRLELEMGQPGVIKFELPPRPQPRAVGPQVIWAELRAKLQQRIESGSKEDAGKIGTKEAALIGAWAYVCAVGRDDEAFGTTEIKTVLGDSWDAFKRKDSLHTGDLKLNPWIDQIGKSNRYSLNADGIDQAKELMKSLIGDAQEA